MKFDEKNSLIKDRDEIKKDISHYLNNNQLKCIQDNKSKLYQGKLSPGCKICMEGTWACIFINMLCTRNCFFCPQDRSASYEKIPRLDGIGFWRVEDFIDYLKKFKFTGVGFSGGEPLLAFDKLITYIKGIRKNIGKSMYIWIYTNGDLATEERLKKLKEAGLDEIRFDLAARNYDLTPVKLAKKYINKVTIETPVIPEDYKILLKSLKEMEKIGVDYLNFHELQVSDFNRKAFVKRDYSFKENISSENLRGSSSIINSQIFSLKLIKHIIDRKLKINFNFCSVIYKNRYQLQGYNKRYSSYSHAKYESLTPLGYVRQFEIKNPGKDLTKYLNSCSGKKNWKSKEKSLHVPEDLIVKLLPFFEAQDKLYINYYRPRLNNLNPSRKNNDKIIKMNSKFSISINKQLYKNIEVIGRKSILYFYLMFIKRRPLNKVINRLISSDLKNINSQTLSLRLSNVMEFHHRFMDLEYLNKELT